MRMNFKPYVWVLAVADGHRYHWERGKQSWRLRQ